MQRDGAHAVSRGEHATGVAQGAKLLPLSQVNQRVSEIPTDPSKPVLIICNTQNRSSALLKSLRNAGGYDHVVAVRADGVVVMTYGTLLGSAKLTNLKPVAR